MCVSFRSDFGGDYGQLPGDPIKLFKAAQTTRYIVLLLNIVEDTSDTKRNQVQATIKKLRDLGCNERDCLPAPLLEKVLEVMWG